MSWSTQQSGRSRRGLGVEVGRNTTANPAESPAGSGPTETPAHTTHTCNDGRGPFFGRKTPGCPRCDELLAGDAPRQLPEWRQDAINRNKAIAAEREVARQEHFGPGGPHANGKCRPVCTFGDW